jgi:putative sigma-54 modulation protein
MEIKIQSIHFDATEKLEAFIEKKIAKLEKSYEDIQKVEVQCKVVKPATAQNKEVSLTVTVPGNTLFVEKVSDTFEESTDLCVDSMKVQLQKYKEKARSR